MTLRNSSLFIVFLGFSVLAATSAGANEEIRVSLFGQPCTMSGPYSRNTLQTIHDISPEKFTPEMSIEKMKRIRNQAAALKSVHSLLESYRDHLRKRLAAQVAFEESLQQAKRRGKASQKLDLLLANVREHIPPAQISAFENTTRIQLGKVGDWNESFLAQTRERYQSLITANPEEEFHKAIRAAKVQYVCAFDEGVEEDSDEDDSDADETAPVSPAAPAAKPAQTVTPRSS